MWRYSSQEEWRGLLEIMGSWECKFRVKRWGRGMLAWRLRYEWRTRVLNGFQFAWDFLGFSAESPTSRDTLSPGGMPIGAHFLPSATVPIHCLSSTPHDCAPHQVMVIQFKLSRDTQNVLLTPKICPHLLTDAWNHHDKTHGVPSHSQKRSTKEYTHYDSLYEISPSKTVFLRVLT